MAEWFETFFDGLYARVLPKSHDDGATLEQARLIKRLLRLRKGQRVRLRRIIHHHINPSAV